MAAASDLPSPGRKEFSNAINIENDGSPGTMVSLFLSRAIAGMYPDEKNAIRITQEYLPE